MSEDRERYIRGSKVSGKRVPEFLNPYPWMSDIDAMVHLELERRRIPFSYRYFDGFSPTLKYFIPDYAPEFTLSDYKIVIVILGDFFGTLPSVLDRTALAKVALEQDGWKMYILLDHEIRAGVGELIDRQIPELIHPTITGDPKPSPLGVPHTMETRRRFLQGLALLRAKFLPKEIVASAGTRVRKYVRSRAVDSGRVRHPVEKRSPRSVIRGRTSRRVS